MTPSLLGRVEGVVKSSRTKSQVSRKKIDSSHYYSIFSFAIPTIQPCPSLPQFLNLSCTWKPNPSKIHWLTWKTLSDSIKPPSNCLLGLSSKQISTCTEVMKQKFSSNKWTNQDMPARLRFSVFVKVNQP